MTASQMPRLAGHRRTQADVVSHLAAYFEVDAAGCWVWTGTLTDDGYPRMFWTPEPDAPRIFGAHRIVLHAIGEPIPVGLQVDHLCRNRACINPDHLEPVTGGENTRRSPTHNAAKTHCPQNHPYDEANTIRQRNGGRLCRTCQRVHNANRKA